MEESKIPFPQFTFKRDIGVQFPLSHPKKVIRRSEYGVPLGRTVGRDVGVAIETRKTSSVFMSHRTSADFRTFNPTLVSRWVFLVIL